MNIFIDTNVYLDIALQREPFVDDSLAIFEKASDSKVVLFIAPHSLATIYYISSRAIGKSEALVLIQNLVELTQVANFDHNDSIKALELNGSDFEDSMVISAAISNRAECIITRNPKDFKCSPIAIFTPEEFLKS